MAQAIKAAFFDVDGTLMSFKTHGLPASAQRALAELRRRGIRTIVSSGRPFYHLPAAVQTGFDAYITLNGQLCFDEAGTFRSAPLPEADVRAIVGEVEAGAFDVLCFLRDGSFASRETPRLAEFRRKVGTDYRPGDIARALAEPVYQFCGLFDPGNEHLVTDVAPSVAITRWTDLFCDIVPAGGGKDQGVDAVLARYGIAPNEAVAFGDGENDLSMFEAVGTSVAMGNARDEVKRAADYVTASVDDDGILRACEHLGLLG